MSRTTVVESEEAQEIWPEVDLWAQEHGWSRAARAAAGPARRYRKGTGFLTAPQTLDVTQEGSRVRLEAAIRIPLFSRICALFVLPESMGVESGGFRAVLPRALARKELNVLLTNLGQPPIG